MAGASLSQPVGNIIHYIILHYIKYITLTSLRYNTHISSLLWCVGQCQSDDQIMYKSWLSVSVLAVSLCRLCWCWGLQQLHLLAKFQQHLQLPSSYPRVTLSLSLSLSLSFSLFLSLRQKIPTPSTPSGLKLVLVKTYLRNLGL